MNREALLEHLVAMVGDAEIAPDLSRYFVATDGYLEFLSGRYHVVYGKPGSGKTAWARMASEQQGQCPELHNVVVHCLATHGAVLQTTRTLSAVDADCPDYESAWTAYVLNAALDTLIPLESELAGRALTDAQSQGARCVDTAPAQRFAWCLSHFGKRLDEGRTFERAQRLEQVMDSCQQAWVARGQRCWILIDGLDGSSLSISQAEAVVAGLLLAQTQMNLSGDAIQLKVFLNTRDSGRRTTWGQRGMQWARRVALRCDVRSGLQFDILGRHIHAATPVRVLTRHGPIGLNHFNVQFENGLFLLPRLIESTGKPRLTFEWMWGRLRDGNGDIAPRDLLRWVAKAAQVELDRGEGKAMGTGTAVLGVAALRQGYAEMSRALVERSFGPASPDHDLAQLLRGGPRRYTTQEIANRFGPRWEQHLNDMVTLGLLKVLHEGVHTVPLLYRPGLSVRSGVDQ